MSYQKKKIIVNVCLGMILLQLVCACAEMASGSATNENRDSNVRFDNRKYYDVDAPLYRRSR